MKELVVTIFLLTSYFINGDITVFAMNNITNEGITEEEAIKIAKDFMIEKGLDKEIKISKAYLYRIRTWYRLEDGSLSQTKPEAGDYKEEKIFDIVFPPKYNKLFQVKFHMFVLVNQKTGEIIEYNYYKW